MTVQKKKVETSRLYDLYYKKIVREMQEKHGYTNPHQIPKLVKIVVSMGTKEAVTDSKAIDKVFDDLWAITCQKPVITKAKKSIAGFKLREGMPLGVKSTLRGQMMYHFLDRFINLALPRVKDFRGLSVKKCDGKGNYAVGLKEHMVFPEINYDKLEKVFGMNIVFVTSAETDEEAISLLRFFNFPFIN